MVTYSQEAEGTMLAAHGSTMQGTGMQASRKREQRVKQLPLFVLVLFSVAIAAAFPYGVGLAVVVWVIALAGALFGAGFATYTLLKELLGKSATFGYAPTAAYLSGKNAKKKREEEPKQGQ